MDKKLGNFWKLMDDFNFKFDGKLPTDLICVLCKNILIDARISSCGCRFCKKCIEQYLVTGDLICPGTSDECSEEMLNLERNVTVDLVVNKKISKMKVPCPIEVCPFVDQMMNMEEHLTVCRSHAVKCPYSKYGCKYASLEAGNISSHLNTNKDGHIDMMVVTIEGLSNKCEKLSSENEVLSNENNSMGEEVKQSKTLIEDLKRHLDDKDKSISLLTIKVTQLEPLKMQLEDKNKSVYSTQTEFVQLENQCELYMDKVDCLKYDLNAYHNANVTEFVCKIINYTDMRTRRTQPASDEFPINPNGTTLQLYSEYQRRSALYSVFAQMSYRGYFTKQPWLVRCNVTIGIVNPNTGQYFTSKKEQMVFSESCSCSVPFNLMESDLSRNNFVNQGVAIKCIVRLLQ